MLSLSGTTLLSGFHKVGHEILSLTSSRYLLTEAPKSSIDLNDHGFNWMICDKSSKYVCNQVCPVGMYVEGFSFDYDTNTQTFDIKSRIFLPGNVIGIQASNYFYGVNPNTEGLYNSLDAVKAAIGIYKSYHENN